MLDYDATTELGQGFLDAYGAYYNVPAALQGHALQSMESTQKIQGVCPEGWHIPSITEWRNLAQYVVDAKMAASINGVVDETAVGKALASTTMWKLPFDTEDAPLPTWLEKLWKKIMQHSSMEYLQALERVLEKKHGWI